MITHKVCYQVVTGEGERSKQTVQHDYRILERRDKEKVGEKVTFKPPKF